MQQRAAALSGNVIFTGYRIDMPAVLNAMDVLVVASSTETGPLVLLEALACGVPGCESLEALEALQNEALGRVQLRRARLQKLAIAPQ